MPPHAYFRFPESSPQHPVDAPLWRLPDMYATAIIPAQVIGLPQPTQLICAVVFPMTDFVAPAQGLMDIDPHNRAALGRLRLLLALLKLKNEPWRASTSATNRTTTFAPTAAPATPPMIEPPARPGPWPILLPITAPAMPPRMAPPTSRFVVLRWHWS